MALGRCAKSRLVGESCAAIASNNARGGSASLVFYNGSAHRHPWRIVWLRPERLVASLSDSTGALSHVRRMVRHTGPRPGGTAFRHAGEPPALPLSRA